MRRRGTERGQLGGRLPWTWAMGSRIGMEAHPSLVRLAGSPDSIPWPGGLVTEPEQHHIPILDHVLFPFGPGEALVTGGLPSPHPHEIGERHGFGADESLLEVGMDH